MRRKRPKPEVIQPASKEKLAELMGIYGMNVRGLPVKSKTLNPIYKAVRKRDGNRCQMPNCQNPYKSVQIHHIRKWATATELRYEETNLICLCKKCHQSIWGKEDFYAPLFNTIVNAKPKIYGRKGH